VSPALILLLRPSAWRFIGRALGSRSKIGERRCDFLGGGGAWCALRFPALSRCTPTPKSRTSDGGAAVHAHSSGVWLSIPRKILLASGA
jgi:hypothetical protein